MYQSVVASMRSQGVPEDCIAKLTTNEAAWIYSTQHAGSETESAKNRMIKSKVQKICAKP